MIIAGIVAGIVIIYFILKGKKKLKKYKASPIARNLIFMTMYVTYPKGSRKAIILLHLNKERGFIGAKPLKSVRTKGNLATQRVLEAVESFSHSEGIDEREELKEDGADGVGELLSRNYFSGEGVVNGFMKSNKGHRKALLKSKYDYCDIDTIVSYKTKKPVDVVLLIDENTVK